MTTNIACPGCSGAPLADRYPGLAKCAGCGGAFTTQPIPWGVARRLVKNDWCACQDGDSRARFYDMLIEDGTRMHGWFDPKCKGITQTG